MKLFPDFEKRLGVAGEFYRMIRDRRLYFMIPVFMAILVILFLLFVGELPVLIPFFYAVF